MRWCSYFTRKLKEIQTTVKKLIRYKFKMLKRFSNSNNVAAKHLSQAIEKFISL